MHRLSLSWLILAECVSFAFSSVSPLQWQDLSDQVEGRLYEGTPASQACFDDFNSAECEAHRKGYASSNYRTRFFGSYVNTNWETCQATGDHCLLNDQDLTDSNPASHPNQCRLGSISPHYIDVRRPSDVTAAFAFSKKTKVPLVVKNTGHDYNGRSSAPDTLALWITFNPSFVPDGCSGSAQPAVTVGAGVQWSDAYEFAEANNITLVGGSDPGVGASGGWLQGGGHGFLTNTMGMGVDRVLQFRVVTPDGRYRVANACQNQDLFFALRGGGGGTFGVVMESTMMASPPITLQVVALFWKIATDDLTRSFFSLLLDNTIQWSKDGWSGAVNDKSIIYVNPIQTQAQSNASIAPLINFGEKLIADRVPGAQLLVLEFPSWGKFFNTFAYSNAARSGTPLALASRLVPRANFASAPARAELLSAIMNAYAVAPGLRLLVVPPSSFTGDGSTSVTHRWRDSMYHITAIETWSWNSSTEFISKQYGSASRAIDFIRDITPDAAYSNEADVHEPNYEVAFWGEHYPRLLAVKRK
ncbi:hypothetical protein EWM64_g1420 [Hericium alpestre]|uniref:FAD-binding PCMH-type domain-containing protein n=1 Tax=Hericium alpestre TaxID=135208 RepID=A0A4Z0A6C2_9AGAM|nr:hypothetical protein EWM64_g1420 [Hericium alpestre]